MDSGDCIYAEIQIARVQIYCERRSHRQQPVNPSDAGERDGLLHRRGLLEWLRRPGVGSLYDPYLNIGTLDYYIGVPSQADNNQFEWGDCHSHWHHKAMPSMTSSRSKVSTFRLGSKTDSVSWTSSAAAAVPASMAVETWAFQRAAVIFTVLA